MNDRETLLEMFKKNNIKFMIFEKFDEDIPHTELDKLTITIEDGYAGLVTCFEFDKENNLIRVGAWE